MQWYTYTFTYQGFEVTYRIMARNKHVANRYAKEQARCWRHAIDQQKEDD